MREDSSSALPHGMTTGAHPGSLTGMTGQSHGSRMQERASRFPLRSDACEATRQTEITGSPLDAGRTQPHPYHGNGAAEVQNPVLQCEVQPEVQVEGSCALCLLSLHGAMPGKEQDQSQPSLPASPSAQEKDKEVQAREGWTCVLSRERNPESSQEGSGFQLS